MSTWQTSRRRSLVLATATGVLAWRAAALFQAPDPSLVQWLLTLAGLVFLACGLLVFFQTPDRDGTLFAAYCLCASLHWGGPLELDPGPGRTAMIFIYLLASGILGETFFLHFGLSFPARLATLGRRGLRALLYGPFLLATLLTPMAVALPRETALQQLAQNGFFLLHTVVTNVFAAAVLVLYVLCLWRRRLDPRERPWLVLMIVGMLAAWLPYLGASIAGIDTDPWNLAMALLPLAFAIAILRIKTLRKTQRAPGAG